VDAIPDLDHRQADGDVTGAATVAAATARACVLTEAWLKTVPAWSVHPKTASGSVAGHRGPTIVSEADCVLHFARFLNQAGVPWEDMHLELSRVQSMYAGTHPAWTMPARWRVDLAVVDRDALSKAQPPLHDSFRFDAFYEFALGSAYWLHGATYGEPAKTRAKVASDVEKVARYVEHGLCHRAYVIVFEECDFGFARDYQASVAASWPGVEIIILKGWST
jgi:hypothetical protein